MVRYRRAREKGGCYFFTLVTHRRRKFLASTDNAVRLRSAFAAVRRNHPFDIDAIVILPDHLHCIWTLPPHDCDFSQRWNLIKGCFSKSFQRAYAHWRNLRVWQDRFWEHLIRDEEDFRRHVDYIHYNPVKHGLVESPAEWALSSFARFVEKGSYDPGWGRSMPTGIEGMEIE